MEKPTFALIGSTGYIAPRHVEAIKAVNGKLIAVLNKDGDDATSPATQGVKKFTNEDFFFSYIGKHALDFVVVCSPSHKHYQHCKKSLEASCNVICEKPVALTLTELNSLLEIEKENNRTINSVFQLRYHPEIQKLKQQDISNYTSANISIKTGRDKAYFNSWKGDYTLSGGVKLNIGIHYFDLLAYLFGKLIDHKIVEGTNQFIKGTLYFSSCDAQYAIELLPKKECETPVKSFLLGKKEIDLTSIENLHIPLYKEIIENRGIRIEGQKQFFKPY